MRATGIETAISTQGDRCMAKPGIGIPLRRRLSPNALIAKARLRNGMEKRWIGKPLFGPKEKEFIVR